MGLISTLMRLTGRGLRNPALVRALRAAAADDSPQTRQALYRALLDSVLIVPAPTRKQPESRPGGRWVTTSEESKPEFSTTQNARGQTIVLAFSDTRALQAWKKESHFVALHASILFPLLLESDLDVAAVVVNPAGPVNWELGRRELEALAAGSAPAEEGQPDAELAVVPGKSPILIDPPTKRPPQEVVARLQETLAQHAEIAAGYLFQTVIGGGDPHLVVGVELSVPVSGRTWNAITRRLARALAPLLQRNEYIDVIILEDDWLRSVQDAVSPIFQRA